MTDGNWRSRLRLALGVCPLRYLADGPWVVDHATFAEYQQDPFGPNAVAKVDA